MLYSLKDSANLTVISQLTNKPVLYADYALTSSIDFKADSVYSMNKNVKSVRFDTQREGSFKTEMEVFETKWIALLFGTSIASGSVDVYKREVLAVNAGGGGATLANTPKSGSLSIFKVSDSKGVEMGEEQVSGNPSTTQNTFSISTAALTFNATTFASSGYVVCYYLLNVTKPKFTVDNVSFPGGFLIAADSTIRGTNQVDKFVQYQLLNIKPKSNVSLAMDVGNVCKLSIEWDGGNFSPLYQ